MIALEARNQLFSLFTFNRYSYGFFCDQLICKDELIKSSGPLKDTCKNVFSEMEKRFQMDLPLVRKGKRAEPGYDEVVSRTHNPFILKEKFKQLGIDDVQIKFYHYHPLPPMFASRFPDFFLKQSIKMENPDDWRGYFMASAFFIIAKT